DVWRAIDAERTGLADLLAGLTAEQWEVPSLCAGWRVREVAAHLTLAQSGIAVSAVALLRARGSLDRMIYDTAVRQARLPPGRYPDLLRGMTGSRKKAPGISHLEPLIDVLVHGQDIAIPLGLARTMPLPAAVAAADRVWPDLYPFRAGRRLAGIRLAATDCSWSAGAGLLAEGPIAAILLALTGRPAAAERLSGPGVTELSTRLAAPVPRFLTA
ncbi:MAG: maleylpyruvate isomerase family mycothiol-dependent enzyme, partial [Actinobacteria bacterium]|nr:maleylpyruvate isomerase family mycothiol-dependent enzyme [Actinomycetota bacterium]